MAIEVDLWLSDGSQRWCCFTNPQALGRFGDWIDGTRIPLHHGARHMIIVAAPLTAALIEAALATLESEGAILTSTLAVAGERDG